jgi:hypothetical protein
MTADRNEVYLAGLLRELCKLPNETEWVEFKASYADPQEIGEYISALSNGHCAARPTATSYGDWTTAPTR